MSAISASSMPQPDGRAVDGGDDGHVGVQQRVGGRREPRLGPQAGADVRSPAAAMTCFTSSPEQNAGSAPVITRHRAVGRAHRVLELGVGGERERVAGLGPVERDDADVVVRPRR